VPVAGANNENAVILADVVNDVFAGKNISP
jgi:hypothetical protein